jgi:hypothetical protein
MARYRVELPHVGNALEIALEPEKALLVTGT